ncbi:MAG: recombinase family protein [Bacteroidota bacterium]
MHFSQHVRYILYVRKSSDSEDRQMASIPDQIEAMTKLAQERGITIVDIITESKSAKQPGRPGFNEVMNKIKCGEADGILCWKLNRLARNPIDAGEISWLLQKGIIKHIQTYGQEYKPSDNVLMMQVEFGIANEYVKNLSSDVIRGLCMKAKRGWYPNPKVAMGYKHNKGYKPGEPEIIPDPQKYEQVKHLWDLMLSGLWSMRKLCKEAQQIGIVSKVGKRLSPSVLYRLFTNPFYAGYFYWTHPKEGKVRHQGKHTPMVTSEEFNRVQRRLSNHGDHIKEAPKYDFIFRGPFSCGECGCHITAEHKLRVICTRCKHKFSAKTRQNCPKCELNISQMESPSVIDKTYYRCTKNAGYCSQRCIEETELRSKISSELQKIVLPPSIAVLVKKAVEINDPDPSIDLEKEVKATYAKKKRHLENLIQMRMAGEISQDQFLEQKEQLEQFLSEASQRLEDLQDKQKWKDQAYVDIALATKIPEVLEQAKSNWFRELMVEVASNPVIKDKKPIFYFRKPFLLFQKLNSTNPHDKPPFEPKKVLDKQGPLGGTDIDCSVLRAIRNELRTLYLEQWPENKGF